LVTLLPTDQLAGHLRSFDMPIVRLGRLSHPDDAIMPVVYPDHGQAGGIAAEVFAERGFTDLATVGHKDSAMADLVEEGFRARATAMGCQYHRHVFVNPGAGGSSQAIYAERYDRRSRALAEWLGKLPKPVGLLASNSSIAGMVSIMCERAGLAVPEDVALLSVGDHRAHCELGPVAISAVDQHPEDLVRVAMNLLEEMMNGRSVPSRTLVPPRGVVTRRSTDILAVDDPIVARAIRYIWDHLDLPLSVTDVASAMKTPRYKLERLFGKYYKRGVHGEVRRARLERFRELLRTTDQTVDELAPQVGYKSAKRLHVAFRDTYGQTPRRYRLQARESSKSD
jgi:LacI family transcriptional regulator